VRPGTATRVSPRSSVGCSARRKRVALCCHPSCQRSPDASLASGHASRRVRRCRQRRFTQPSEWIDHVNNGPLRKFWRSSQAPVLSRVSRSTFLKVSRCGLPGLRGCDPRAIACRLRSRGISLTGAGTPPGCSLNHARSRVRTRSRGISWGSWRFRLELTPSRVNACVRTRELRAGIRAPEVTSGPAGSEVVPNPRVNACAPVVRAGIRAPLQGIPRVPVRRAREQAAKQANASIYDRFRPDFSPGISSRGK